MNRNNFDIETDRLQLRIFKASDITPEYINALNSPDIIGLTESRYQTWNISKVRQYVHQKANKPGESILIGIFLKEGKRHIGNIRLHSFSAFNKRVEVGILIWNKQEWSKGYATEALSSLITYIFKVLKLHKICAEYYACNKASASIFEKLNFTKEGVFKDHFIVNNHFVDAVRIAKINLAK